VRPTHYSEDGTVPEWCVGHTLLLGLNLMALSLWCVGRTLLLGLNLMALLQSTR